MSTQIDKLTALGVKTTSIDPHIHIIQGLMRGRSPFGNIILILDKTTTLIDTGCGQELLEKILQTVTVDLVINSHSHPDHTGGNWRVIEHSRPTVMIPEGSQETIGHAHRLAVRMVGEDLAAFWMENNLSTTGYRNFAHSGVFSEGHCFELGQIQLLALHTPGHTRDHFCFYEPQRKIIFGSDIDLSPFGPWYGNVESSLPEFKAAITRMCGLAANIYIPAHAKPVQGRYIAKRLHAYAQECDRRSQVIHALIKTFGPISLADLVLKYPIYECADAPLDKIVHYSETRMDEKHIGELIEAGLITHIQDGLLRAI